VPFGKTIHDAETFYVVESQVVINGVEIIEALFLTYSQFYIFYIEYYQDNIASWQFIQHVIALSCKNEYMHVENIWTIEVHLDTMQFL
jgi:hypothetical protein